jgi:hypothetical protein
MVADYQLQLEEWLWSWRQQKVFGLLDLLLIFEMCATNQTHLVLTFSAASVPL